MGSMENIEDPEYEVGSDGCAWDVQICDVLLELLEHLCPSEDSALKTECLVSERWWDHAVYGPLAKSFRESQRKLVKSNIHALRCYKDHMLSQSSKEVKNDHPKKRSREDRANLDGVL